jgi:hypothetical protein
MSTKNETRAPIDVTDISPAITAPLKRAFMDFVTVTQRVNEAMAARMIPPLVKVVEKATEMSQEMLVAITRRGD